MTTSPGIRSNFQATHRPPTKLHQHCEQSQSIAELVKGRIELLKLSLPRKDILGFAYTRDAKGKCPLHLLSENKAISEDLAKLEHTQTDEDNMVTYFHDVEPRASFENNDPSREQSLERFVVNFLLLASPSAAMSRDDQGQIPFEGALTAWVNQFHDEMLHSRGVQNKNDLGFHTASLVVTNALKLAKKTAKRTVDIVNASSKGNIDGSSKKSYSQHRNNGGSMSPDVERGRARSVLVECVNEATPSDVQHKQGATTKEIIRTRCFPLHVRLTSHMYFALKMLSKIIEKLDQLTSNHSVRHFNNNTTSPNSLHETDSFDKVLDQSFAGTNVYQEVKETIIFNIACIPDLVKTILLIESDSEREYVLNSTIIRRVLLSKYSVGPWLTAMLQSHKSRVSKRAVGYLKRVSDLSVTEKPAAKKAKSDSDSGRHFEWHRDELHNEICRLQDFVPSILSLGEKGVEDAATTMVVRRVMDRIISSPFAVSVIFCDVLFLLMLIFGFRSAVNNLILRGNPRAVMRGIYVANTGIFYFIIRELGKVISLFMISHRAQDYLKSFWNLTDLTATVLALISVITIRSISRADEGLNIVDMHGVRDLLAVTTGFLWLRVLSLLKGVNMQMATFILAILQITKDTLTFGVILCVMVICFAQIFFTVLVPGFCSKQEGEFEDPESDCVQAEYYFRVYTVLLGEFGAFERSSFKTWFSLFMMVVYSFMVIIVLLNVLIAVASDSYEKCLMKSQRLFGRARVMLIAELVSFQNLLRKTGDAVDPVNQQNLSPNSSTYHKWWAGQSFARNWSRGSILFFGLSSMVVMFWAIGEIAGYISGERYSNVLLSVGSILINMTLFAAIMLFLSRGSENISSKRGDLIPAESNITDNSGLPLFMQRLMLRIMGSSQDSWNLFREGDQHENTATDEWRGRVHHLQSRMDHLVQESAKNSTKQTQALEQLVANTEMRLKSDMTNMDNSVTTLKAELLLEMKKSQTETLNQMQEYMKRLMEEMDQQRKSSIF